MNRQEFMAQLSRLLLDIDELEREAALDYYESYFDDAGEENEDTVIQKLGSPGKVAAMIKADLNQDNHRHGEYTEIGYEDRGFEEPKQTPERINRKNNSQEDGWTQASDSQKEYSYGNYESYEYDQNRYQGRKPRTTSGWILLVIVLVFASPLILGLAGGVLGIVGAIFGLLVGLIGLIIGFVTGGVALVVKGIAALFTHTAVGLVQFGAGLLLTALGILFIVLLVLCVVKVLPKLYRWCVNLVQRVLHRGRNGDQYEEIYKD